MSKMSDPSEGAQAAIKALELEDPEEEPATVVSMAALDGKRRAIYAAGLPDYPLLSVESGAEVVAVTCESENGLLEHVVTYHDGEATPIIVTDKIMYDEVPATQIIEYQFSEDGPWLLSNITQGSLEMYRSSKFKQWKDLLLDGGGKCKVTFKRMLNTGLITNMYDHAAFPSPENEKKDWQVLNDNGKIVDVPRPVFAIRVYNAETKQYDALEARMDGAPSPGDEKTTWDTLVSELRVKFGDDEVDPHLSK